MLKLKWQMLNERYGKRKGITLIELLIYLAITAIVLVVVIDLVTRVAQNQSKSAGQGGVNANARFLVDRLTYSISEGSTITGSYPADNLYLTVAAQQVSFTLTDGQIFYQEGAGGQLPLTDSTVEILPINPGESIFNKVINGTAESVQIRFKVTFKQNNLSRDFETAVLVKGK